MPSLGIHVVFLLCIVAGYFVIVESRSYAIKDSYNRNPNTILKKKLYSYAEIAKWLKNHLNDEKIKRNKENQHVIKAFAKLIKKEMERRKLHAKLNLRNGMEVQDFLHKLNHFINENTQHNNYYEKRFDCKFGFGSPSRVCKSQKFRRHYSKPKNGHNPKKHYNYAQAMFVERAGSSSSSSDEQTAAKPKYRFKVVNNKRKKQDSREISEFEESSEDYSDDSDVKTKHTSYSDETSNEDDKPIKTKHILSYSDENSNEYKRKRNKKHGSEESAQTSDVSSMEGKDVKYLYLQGTRLQKPDFRSGRWKSGRRGDRLPYFMPKRHKWDSHLFHHIDTYWENINVADTYNLKKYGSW